ncbi:MAG: mechanosensitive ion channel family protein [Geminicoccaceae bacterium]
MSSTSSHARHFLIFLISLFAIAAVAPPSCALRAQEPQPWEGEWQIVSRTGQFIMNLNQTGNEVTGTVEPGSGTIEGVVAGRLLQGRWTRGASGGAIKLALSEDGQTLTGRFDNSEYLNGQRIIETSDPTTQFTAAFSPRETLRTVITSMNEAFLNANPAAVRFFMPLLIFEQQDEETSLTDASYKAKSLDALWHLINLSTFRIFEAPLASDTRETVFNIGPDSSDISYDLLFRYDDSDDRWKIVVGALDDLGKVIDRMLDDLGHETYEEFEIESKQSPRATMSAFLKGTENWRFGGQAEALAELDLSFLPEHLQRVEGPILADYLLQIVDRAGFVVPQEIPNNSSRITPYVHYSHPLGSIVIEKVRGEKGQSDRWLFSTETLKSAPVLFNAIQDMPLAEGVGKVEPLTDFFRTREAIRAFSSVLLHRDFVLENWQWITLLLALIVALLVAWAISRLATNYTARFNGGKAQHGIKWPIRIFIAGFMLQFVAGRLGIAQSGLSMVGQAITVFTVIGLTLLLYRVISFVGSFLIRRAEKTVGYFDEIVSSLATGMAKLIVVVVGVAVCADVIGIPYEGVITGLGVGGVALAFASRDTVSNMLGGMLLLADRPFKRGDLVETEGQWAMIEDVGLRSTRLKTFDDAQLIIPNAQLSDKAIVNWGKRLRRKVAFDIALTYDTPREKLDLFVERLAQIYEKQPRADVKECYIGLKTFASSSIDIEFWGYFNVYSYEAHVLARHVFIGDVIDLTEEVGVSFAFPTRTVHMMMENQAS